MCARARSSGAGEGGGRFEPTVGMRVLASASEVWESVRDLPLDALFPMRAGLCILEGGGAVRPGATLRMDSLDGSAWRCTVESRDQDRRRVSWIERPLVGAETPSAGQRWFAISVTAPAVRTARPRRPRRAPRALHTVPRAPRARGMSQTLIFAPRFPDKRPLSCARTWS